MHIMRLFFFLSCPVLTNNQMLAVMKNGQGPEALFRIQMFKFVGSSYTDIFLHCNIQICHSSAGACRPVRSYFLYHSQITSSTFTNSTTASSNVQNVIVEEINKNIHTKPVLYVSQLKSHHNTYVFSSYMVV